MNNQVKSSYWEINASNEQDINSLNSDRPAFVKRVKRESDDVYYIKTTSCRMTQVQKWLPESTIKTSKPLFICPEPQKVVRKPIQENLEDMVNYYTEKNMIELQIDLITKKEVCNYYLKYLKDSENEANFVHYLRRNRGKKELYAARESYERNIFIVVRTHFKNLKEYKELLDEDEDGTKTNCVLDYRTYSYKKILKHFLDSSLHEEVETGKIFFY